MNRIRDNADTRRYHEVVGYNPLSCIKNAPRNVGAWLLDIRMRQIARKGTGEQKWRAVKKGLNLRCLEDLGARCKNHRKNYYLPTWSVVKC